MRQIEKQARADNALAAYRTILVHAEADRSSESRVRIAAKLARRAQARLIGMGALTCRPLTADPFAGVGAAEWLSLLEDELIAELKAAEGAFRRASEGVDIEWRAAHDLPHLALCRSAAAADLVVLGPKGHLAETQRPDPAEVVLAAGRPVLLAPSRCGELRARTVLIAWKDTRECRRAIADSMPFLKAAQAVLLAAIVPPEQERAAGVQMADVLWHLDRHGVVTRPITVQAQGRRISLELERIADQHGADLIVAGAYGHSRFREWVFGGVTRDFLEAPPRCVFLSH